MTPESIIEAVYQPDTATTAFVVATDDGITTVPKVIVAGETHEPISPANNLLKHGAVLLPSEPMEYGTEAELLAEIESYLSRYVSLLPNALALTSAYILLSWVYDAFNELPYLRFRGDYGTGKTRALITVGGVCYKPVFASGASTVSPIFHLLDTFRGTLVFDEADFRFSDEKAELVKILNNGNVKGFSVLRTQATAQKYLDPTAFYIYGSKIIGMRTAYQDRALESRFLTVEMEPGHATGVPINLPDRQKEEALALRNKLLMYRLRNRRSVALDTTLADPRLEPRLNQILLPLLSVVGEDRRAAIRSAAEHLQAGIVLERSGSTEGQLLAVVSGMMAGGEAPITLASIAAAFQVAHGRDYERPITARWIGSMLRRLGIVLYKSNGALVMAGGQDERFTLLRKRYGIESAPEPASAGDEVTK
ncbi:DUF3631 domain-containing protein [Azospirillaceae bacterium]